MCIMTKQLCVHKWTRQACHGLHFWFLAILTQIVEKDLKQIVNHAAVKPNQNDVPQINLKKGAKNTAQKGIDAAQYVQIDIALLTIANFSWSALVSSEWIEQSNNPTRSCDARHLHLVLPTDYWTWYKFYYQILIFFRNLKLPACACRETPVSSGSLTRNIWPSRVEYDMGLGRSCNFGTDCSLSLTSCAIDSPLWFLTAKTTYWKLRSGVSTITTAHFLDNPLKLFHCPVSGKPTCADWSLRGKPQPFSDTWASSGDLTRPSCHSPIVSIRTAQNRLSFFRWSCKFQAQKASSDSQLLHLVLSALSRPWTKHTMPIIIRVCQRESLQVVVTAVL